MIGSIVRWVHRVLNGQDQSSTPFLKLSRSAVGLDAIVMAFYAASVYLAVNLIPQVTGLAETANEWNFVWVLKWLPKGSEPFLLEIIAIACAVSAVIALVARHMLWARLAFFVLFLFSASVPNSVGGINHPYHAWIFVSFIFVFLPNKTSDTMDRAEKMALATVIRTAQSLILLFYSMAGMEKLYQGVTALAEGGSGNLSWGALTWTLTDRAMQTGTTPILIDLVVNNTWAATIMMWGVIYVQVVAVVIAFRPSLHAVWAMALITFHLGTWALMEIIFTQHILLLCILFLMRPEPTSLRSLFTSLRFLPGLAFFLSKPRSLSAIGDTAGA